MSLLDTIQADALALQLANAGDDIGCAARCTEIMPRVRVAKMLTERGLYDAIGAEMAESVLQKLEALALTNPVVKRALKWLEPSNDGIDFGSLIVLGMLSQLTTAGMLTQQEYDAINGMSLEPQTISASQVSEAMASIRIDGKVNNG